MNGFVKTVLFRLATGVISTALLIALCALLFMDESLGVYLWLFSWLWPLTQLFISVLGILALIKGNSKKWWQIADVWMFFIFSIYVLLWMRNLIHI